MKNKIYYLIDSLNYVNENIKLFNKYLNNLLSVASPATNGLNDDIILFMEKINKYEETYNFLIYDCYNKYKKHINIYNKEEVDMNEVEDASLIYQCLNNVKENDINDFLNDKNICGVGFKKHKNEVVNLYKSICKKHNIRNIKYYENNNFFESFYIGNANN